MRYLPPDFKPPSQRVCRCCGRLLPITAFYEDKHVRPELRSRYAARCIECVRAEKNARYGSDPAAGAAMRRDQRARKKLRDAEQQRREQAAAKLMPYPSKEAQECAYGLRTASQSR
ncbi:TPA: hypothetical protein QDA71_006080 [Burkholderia vietnamiensis]|uniref:hypothetical protein n=1 Tax=Burkholderia vietnamiensis TaxID=60552 RepID=UPI0007574260|nr:hypothetical protein [Burkholderia vietnamiensis]KVF07830.1 hypothetical protein WJ04_12235 [Burkholderia vietnamiensis]KVF25238.1 hypothetical protein WJ08_03940 [Burkholderia vietnamiensis]KVF36425.1 hypothetical protein WJ10_27465 [Burkholderia vietnamiensis]KVF74579.1 hypothetical protein WJ18_24755 [Burkholderia vietnamiensis]KVF86642.1 hypothetical protein WJ19_12625 [Burkholderia vietnamiensis]